jgi:hypothetical protein
MEKVYQMVEITETQPEKSMSWEWVEWLEKTVNFIPVAHVTLTFEQFDISGQLAWNKFKKWIHEINKEVLGPKYKRSWKHCYFSYVVVPEYQTRGTIHYHVLIDNWFPWKFAQKLWWDLAGFIKIKKVNNTEAAIRYVMKYITKEGEPVVWLAHKRWERQISVTMNINDIVNLYLDERVPDLRMGR